MSHEPCRDCYKSPCVCVQVRIPGQGWCKPKDMPPDVGQKNDQAKLRYSLLPLVALEEVVRVLEFGAKKYGENNWKKVPNAEQRYWDACLRHVLAYKRGEELDPESGLSHLAHAICCLMFLEEGFSEGTS